MTREQAAELVAEASRLVAEEVRRRGHGGRALTSLVLRALKQARYSAREPRPRRAALRGLLPLHLADPPLPRPRLPPRASCSIVGGGEDAPRRSSLDEAGEWTSGRERDAMVIERDADDVAAAFLLERELFASGKGSEREFDGEVVGLVGAGAFVAFDALRGLPARAPAARRLVGARRDRHDAARRGVGAAAAPRRPARGRRAPHRGARAGASSWTSHPRLEARMRGQSSPGGSLSRAA